MSSRVDDKITRHSAGSEPLRPDCVDPNDLWDEEDSLDALARASGALAIHVAETAPRRGRRAPASIGDGDASAPDPSAGNRAATALHESTRRWTSVLDRTTSVPIDERLAISACLCDAFLIAVGGRAAHASKSGSAVGQSSAAALPSHLGRSRVGTSAPGHGAPRGVPAADPRAGPPLANSSGAPHTQGAGRSDIAAGAVEQHVEVELDPIVEAVVDLAASLLPIDSSCDDAGVIPAIQSIGVRRLEDLCSAAGTESRDPMLPLARPTLDLSLTLLTTSLSAHAPESIRLPLRRCAWALAAHIPQQRIPLRRTLAAMSSRWRSAGNQVLAWLPAAALSWVSAEARGCAARASTRVRGNPGASNEAGADLTNAGGDTMAESTAASSRAPSDVDGAESSPPSAQGRPVVARPGAAARPPPSTAPTRARPPRPAAPAAAAILRAPRAPGSSPRGGGGGTDPGLPSILPPSIRSLVKATFTSAHLCRGQLTDAQPIMAAFQGVLLEAARASIRADPSVALELASVLLEHWPVTDSGLEALFISSYAAVLDAASGAPGDLHDNLLLRFLPRLSACVASENFRVAERALVLWDEPTFASASARLAGPILEAVFPGLYRDGELHWNPTVNAMTLHVVDMFLGCAPDELRAAALAHARVKDLDDPESFYEVDFKPYHARVREKWEKVEADKVPRPSLGPDRRFGDGDAATATLKHSDFIFGHELGVGSFSVVRQARLRDISVPQRDWRTFAVKILDREHVAAQGYAEHIRREVQLMRRLAGSAVCRLHCHFEDHRSIYLVSDYHPGGDLFGVIARYGSLPVALVRHYAAELVLALEHLDAHGVAFNDLKPENVLVDGSGHLILTDFGSACTYEDVPARSARDGTAAYVPPELAARAAAPGPASDARARDLPALIGNAGDLWALGVTVYQMVAGRTPYWAETLEGTLGNVVSFQRTYPPGFPSDARDLVDALLDADPTRRAGFSGSSGSSGSGSSGGGSSSSSIRAESEAGVSGAGPRALRSHPFFSGIDFDTLRETSPPSAGKGGIAARAPGGAKWAQRAHSMLHAPLTRSGGEVDEAEALDPVGPEPDDWTAWPGRRIPEGPPAASRYPPLFSEDSTNEDGAQDDPGRGSSGGNDGAILQPPAFLSRGALASVAPVRTSGSHSMTVTGVWPGALPPSSRPGRPLPGSGSSARRGGPGAGAVLRASAPRPPP